jgi:hypothetical protein
MRLSRNETIELMASIIKVRNGEKPGFFSNICLKKVYSHSKFNELDRILKEIKAMELSLKSQEDIDNIMKKTAQLINVYLDN